jgi:hypothetical protein
LKIPAFWTLAAVLALQAGNEKRPAGAAARSDALVFVVSARQPTTKALSSAELRQIFAGRMTRWKGGRRILLAMRPPTTPAGRAFFEDVVRMSDIDFSRLWLGIIFRGEAISSPRVLESKDDVERFLARSPDGLSFLLSSEKGNAEKLRALIVDGLAPDDGSYPFRISE